MRRSFASLLLLLLLLAGCAQSGSPVAGVGRHAVDENASRAERYNQFGFHLYAELPGDENKLVSPLSVALALAMTYNGADGDTGEEMARMLQAQDIDLRQFNQQNQELSRRLQDVDVTLNLVNSLWLRRGISVKDGFVQDNRTFYDAEVRALDFADPQTVDAINGWVGEQTNDLIDGVVAGPIDPDALMFLINAVYFQGDWQREFLTSQTGPGQFQTGAGAVTVPFMQQSGNYDYLENGELQAIRLPYGDGRVAMYVFLPRDLAQFTQQLAHGNWRAWMDGFAQANGELRLPRFGLEYEASLNDALQALGMVSAFADTADFGRMTDAAALINEVKHKAAIKVDERGTEAAAVTSVQVYTTSAPPQPQFVMTVDRPFFFVIHDSETDVVLFMGTVVDPS